MNAHHAQHNIAGPTLSDRNPIAEERHTSTEHTAAKILQLSAKLGVLAASITPVLEKFNAAEGLSYTRTATYSSLRLPIPRERDSETLKESPNIYIDNGNEHDHLHSMLDLKPQNVTLSDGVLSLKRQRSRDSGGVERIKFISDNPQTIVKAGTEVKKVPLDKLALDPSKREKRAVLPFVRMSIVSPKPEVAVAKQDGATPEQLQAIRKAAAAQLWHARSSITKGSIRAKTVEPNEKSRKKIVDKYWSRESRRIEKEENYRLRHQRFAHFGHR